MNTSTRALTLLAVLAAGYAAGHADHWLIARARRRKSTAGTV